MVAEFGRFFGRKVLLLIRLKVFLHLLHDMLGLVKVLNIQVCRGPGNLLRMTTLRTKFPLLETIHVREQTARGAPDDKVHTNEVIGVIVINIYRRFAEKTGARTHLIHGKQAICEESPGNAGAICWRNAIGRETSD
jgi:hypothetical protein